METEEILNLIFLCFWGLSGIFSILIAIQNHRINKFYEKMKKEWDKDEVNKDE